MNKNSLIYLVIFLYVSIGNISYAQGSDTSNASGLSVEYRKGKTYITWNEKAGTGMKYRLYRSLAPITDITSLRPLVQIDQGSGYDPRYKRYHVIKDLGTPLSPGTGLFVYTPKRDESTYYAVTVVESGIENISVTMGDNSLSLPVTEKYQKWPQGVLYKIDNSYHRNYYYFYWMDYFNWPNNYDYYGENYVVNVNRALFDKNNLPLSIWLHGYEGMPIYRLPSQGSNTQAIRLNIRDNAIPGADFAHTWWYGLSNNYGAHSLQTGDKIVDYTSQRVIHYIHAVLSDSRFSLDQNRVYLGGQSMGGGGTLLIGTHYPDLFASLNPVIARVSYDERSFIDRFGSVSLGLTDRNGTPIYKAANVTWIAENNPAKELPPIVNLHGSKDPLHFMYTHTHLYQTLARTRHGIWGKWLDIGHETADYGNTIPGGVFRFLRNEMFPAFSNATTNDNYGVVRDYDENSIPIKPSDFTADATGVMNMFIDWSSSLHDLIPESTADDLIDTEQRLQFSFISSRPNTKVDITPRRIQNFQVISGHTYKWQNIDLLNESIISTGLVQPDSNNLITIPQFSISSSGNILVITPEGDLPPAAPINLQLQMH